MSDLDISTAPAAATDPVATPIPALEIPVEAHAETETATTETQPGDPAQDTAKPEAAKTEDKDKPKNSAQQRIDELTRTMRDAERRALQSQQEVARLQARLQEKAAKIDPNDFTQTDDFRVEKAVASGRIEEAADTAQQSIRDARAQRAEVYFAKVEAALERDPSLEQSLQAFARLPVQETAATIIADSPIAAELAAHLGKNPREFDRIAKLPDGLQGAELARLEAKLSAAPVRRISQAPAPVPTLGGSRSPAVKDTADMSISEMQAMLYRKSGSK